MTNSPEPLAAPSTPDSTGHYPDVSMVVQKDYRPHDMLDPVWNMESERRGFVFTAFTAGSTDVETVDPETLVELMPDDAKVLRVSTISGIHSSHALVEIDGTLCVIRLERRRWWASISAPDTSLLKPAQERIGTFFPEPAAKEDQGKTVSMAVTTCGGHGTVRAIPVSPWDEIKDGYHPETRKQLDELMALREPRNRGRLIIWHGQPGCGKTYAATALAHQFEEWCGSTIIADPDVLLDDPDYLTTVTWYASVEGKPFNLVVLEDTGEMLGDSAANYGQRFSRLLNFADGILGQGSSTLFLITTNEPIESLHPAITRTGRCLAAIEFLPLPVEDAKSWLEAHDAGNLASRITAPVPISDLFAMKNGVIDSPTGKASGPIGFIPN